MVVGWGYDGASGLQATIIRLKAPNKTGKIRHPVITNEMLGNEV